MIFLLMFFSLAMILCATLALSVSFGTVSYSILLLSFNGIDFVLSFLFDYISMGFFCSVSLISSLVFLYSTFYMEGTTDSRRFNWLVFSFVLSMAILVFASNLLTLMIGWDGLGLTSFCLVIFYNNHSSLESGLITVLSNRIGDVFFLACFILIFCMHQNSTLMFCFLFIGAITKSAQFPFSAWLPAAMAAPTPVSSLVHSSTLVTAGVYVLLRYHHICYYLPFLKTFFIFTMALAGFCACLETDLKKIVAMSTLSQLGLMLFTLSLGVWKLTFLHMIIHAFFKSLLFMSTGSLMDNLMGGQDSRLYSTNTFSFITYLTFFVSCICLMGFPFCMGFYSKDSILLSSSKNLGAILYMTFILGCSMTVYYSLRLLNAPFSKYLTCMPQTNFNENKTFITSIFYLYFKCWILSMFFFVLYFFENNSIFLGLDLSSGLVLIFVTYLFSTKANSPKTTYLYKQRIFIYSIGYLRWLLTANNSVSNKMHHWDMSWLELGGGQGTFQFLKLMSNFDKILTLGLMVVLMCCVSLL